MGTPQRQFDFTFEKQTLEDCSSNFADTMLASVPVEVRLVPDPRVCGSATAFA
jgi:hypothetical protein